MDVATVPFTVVTYSEPHREVAEAVDVPVTPFEQLASLPPPSQPVQPSSERDGRAYASPAGDTSDTDSDSEFEGRERTADEQMALDLQRDELSRSGLSPAGRAAGLAILFCGQSPVALAQQGRGGEAGLHRTEKGIAAALSKRIRKPLPQ